MFCMKCGSQTENTDGICDNCKKETTPESVSPVITQGSNKKSSMIKLSKDQLIHAGLIAGSTAIISFILSAITALIINLAARNYISLVMDKYSSGLFSLDSFTSVSPYMVWRMSFLNSFVLRAGLGSITLSARYIILILIPALSFFISWMLVNKTTIREKFPKLFLEKELHLDFKKFFEIILLITAFYTILFALTSFIPITLLEQNLGFLDATYKVFYEFTFLSSLLGTAIVVFITNALIGLYYKFISLDKTASQPIVKPFLHIYTKYLLNSSAIAVGFLLVILFRNNLWKQIITLITALPNLVLFVMNIFVGGLKITSSDGIRISLFKVLTSQGKFALVCLTIAFLLLTMIAFIQAFQKLAKDNTKKYWIDVSIVTAFVIAAQIIVCILASIHIRVWEVGDTMRMSISSNILILVLVIAAIGAASGAAVLYLPKNLLKLVHITENQKNMEKPNKVKENMEPLILGGLLLLTLILGIIGTGKNSTITSSNNYENPSIFEDSNSYTDYESHSILDPERIDMFDNGYVFFDNGNYHLYRNNKISIINLEEGISDHFTFSSKEDKILVETGSSLKVINGDGKNISKQEITYDRILGVSKDYNNILFYYDNELTLYNCKKDVFTVLELTDESIGHSSSRAYFDTKNENIYFVGDSIISYNIKSRKETVLFEEAPEIIFMDKIYVMKPDSKIPVALEDGAALTYGYEYDDYNRNFNIVKYTEEGTQVILSNIDKFFSIDKNKYAFIFENSSDTFVYNASSEQLYNISSEIRYLSMNSKIKGGK